MPIYRLLRLGDTDWDHHRGFVIRAQSEDRARELASLFYKENYDDFDGIDAVWLHPECSSCEILSEDGPEEILLEDFRT